jgi:hypothetical protein
MSRSANPNPAATNIPTEFPDNNIKLTDVCDEYSVSRNLNALQTRVVTIFGANFALPAKYYKKDGTEESAGASGTTISLGQFRGAYSKECTGNMADQNVSNTAGSGGHGVQAVVGFNTCSYILRGKHFYKLTINFYAQGNAQGTAASAGYNSQSFTVTYRGATAYTGSGVQTHVLNDLGGAGENIPGQLVISCSTNASNNLGDQASASTSWTYNVNYYGISGPV